MTSLLKLVSWLMVYIGIFVVFTIDSTSIVAYVALNQ